MRSGGTRMPRSAAILRRRDFTRRSRSPPFSVSTTSMMSGARSRPSGSTWISSTRSSGVSRSGGASAAAAVASAAAVSSRALDLVGGQQHQATGDDEGDLGQARDQAQREGRAAGDPQGQLLAAELLEDVRAHVGVAGGAGDDEAGGDREQQRRDLRDQAVTDGEQAVGLDRVAQAHAVLRDADGEAADQVDQRDDDGRDRVALDELRGTVHRAVEVGLGVHLLAAPAGLLLVDEAGVEVGVDGHLLAGHRVEGEAGAHLGDAAGTVGDDDELDDEQDREHDQADDQRATDDEVAEGVDHLPGVPVDEDQPRGAHVEGQAEQGHHEHDGREAGEVQGPVDEHRRQQDQQGTGDVERDEDVEHHRRERDDQHHDDHHDAEGDAELAHPLHRVGLIWLIGGRPSGDARATGTVPGASCAVLATGLLSAGQGRG